MTKFEFLNKKILIFYLKKNTISIKKSLEKYTIIINFKKMNQILLESNINYFFARIRDD